MDKTILQTNDPSRKIAVGMFHYSDGSTSFEQKEDQEISAIVALVESKGFWSFCLDQHKLPWASNNLRLVIPAKLSGKEATQMLLEQAEKHSGRVEAASYCFNYHQNGIKAGQAFLPSIEETIAIFRNIKEVNQSLEKIKAPLIKSIVSATSPCEDCVCCYSTHGIRYAEQTALNNVRPVLFTEF